ncbi:leukocyte elastase inhibitor-like [Cottoperca gobio]|uniref:Serpin B6 n=1 Tax=Cottoperca gobio TaxID=56716 RepID=A0A6J2RT70_COTGO|nr:leukocyte elastase inhibitor-like [Cottoperca gobio]XP_029313145.1 leukocyte elastase inhibitor-like [Cottoperca gobio]
METPTPSKISKANTTFSLALLKKLSDDDKTANIFYSPFSISSALAMVMLGTKGSTATQMSKVLAFTDAEQPLSTVPLPTVPQLTQTQTQSPMHSQMTTRMQIQTQIHQSSRLPQYLLKCLSANNGQDDVHASFAELLSELNKEDVPYALSLANRLYGEQSYQFVEEFLAETRTHYNAELESVDFKAGAEAARVNINSWVEKQTQHKIKDLLVKDAVNSATRLVLVNAIYFKGNWNKQFQEDSTIDAPFRMNKNDSKSVKMMRQKSEFSHTTISEANCQVLEMSYEGKDLSMLIFLPNEIEDDTTGLEKLEKELTYEKFVDWTRSDKMDLTEVEVRLPRFKMEETYDLNDVLISMGMTDAFDVQMSDFSGMSLTTDLVLSKVVHKAFVEINEEGTEAAAATAAGVTVTSILIPVTFNADHPFLFFIRHNPTMSILFAGRYCSPN